MLHVGTSAFGVKEWKGGFYPERIRNEAMLAYYAERLPAVEINSSFRQLPKAEALGGWAAQTPAGFRFTLKAPQQITHFRRLADVEEPVGQLLTASEALGERLGALLFQLPPNFRKDIGRLEGFLELLPETTRVAMEFRHASWFDEDVHARLRKRNVALCAADTDEAEAQLVRTADWGYLRLRRAEYDDSALCSWLNRIERQGWQETFVFFKHEETGTGPRFAERLLNLAAGR